MIRNNVTIHTKKANKNKTKDEEGGTGESIIKEGVYKVKVTPVNKYMLTKQKERKSAA